MNINKWQKQNLSGKDLEKAQNITAKKEANDAHSSINLTLYIAIATMILGGAIVLGVMNNKNEEKVSKTEQSQPDIGLLETQARFYAAEMEKARTAGNMGEFYRLEKIVSDLSRDISAYRRGGESKVSETPENNKISVEELEAIGDMHNAAVANRKNRVPAQYGKETEADKIDLPEPQISTEVLESLGKKR